MMDLFTLNLEYLEFFHMESKKKTEESLLKNFSPSGVDFT